MSITNNSLQAQPPLIPSSYSKLTPGRYETIQLYTEDLLLSSLSSWRYELIIVDRTLDQKHVNDANIAVPCAVFFVPAGRESEYTFSTRRGLLSVCQSAKCARLIAVSFSRNLSSPGAEQSERTASQAEVQEELTPIVQILAANGMGIRDQKQIPFMAVNGLGNRDIIAQGGDKDSATGQYIVEECEVDGGVWVRRLYFLNNANVIQSEVAVIREGVGATSNSSVVDPLRLMFEYHLTIVAGFMALLPGHQIDEDDCTFMLSSNNNNNALVIGVGGGGLLTFLDRFFGRTLSVTAVELDGAVVEIAKSHFGFREMRATTADNGSSDGTKVIIGNGLSLKATENESHIIDEQKEVAQNSDQNNTSPETNTKNKNCNTSNTILLPQKSQSLIVIDVDSKDSSVGMSCPPIAFLSLDYLQTLYNLLLPHGRGLLAINVSARNPEMLQMVKNRVGNVFKTVYIGGNQETNNDEDEEEVFGEEEREALNLVVFATTASTVTTPQRSLHPTAHKNSNNAKNDIAEIKVIVNNTTPEERRLQYIAQLNQCWDRTIANNLDISSDRQQQQLQEVKTELEDSVVDIQPHDPNCIIVAKKPTKTRTNSSNQQNGGSKSKGSKKKAGGGNKKKNRKKKK